jgi:ATP-dependent DNA helicase RecG
VTEGLVNALIHRSYTELGSEVHIDMFDDRIEIFSPGGMVSGITLDNENIMNIPSRRRNPVLADIFSRLNYMERRGSGFKKIIEDYRIQENYNEHLKPQFYAKYDDFILTLYNLNYSVPQDVTQDVTQGVTQDVSQDSLENQILCLIRKDNKISTEKISEILGVSSKTIKRRIKEMDNIEYIGSGFSGHWYVVDDD